MEITIKSLSEELAKDFFNFFDSSAFSDNPNWSFCYCNFYHFNGSDEEWMKQTGESNKLAVMRLIQERKMRGYIVYLAKNPIGWCNINDKTNYARLASNNEVWDYEEQKIASIVCFIIAPEHRRKGIASRILDRICSDYSKKGYDYIEAYPRKGELTSAQHYHGPLAMYMKAGFEIYKEFSDYNIVRKKL